MYKSMPHSPRPAQMSGAENTALIQPPLPSLLVIADAAENRLVELHAVIDKFEIVVSKLIDHNYGSLPIGDPNPKPHGTVNLLSTLDSLNSKATGAVDRLGSLVQKLDASL